MSWEYVCIWNTPIVINTRPLPVWVGVGVRVRIRHGVIVMVRARYLDYRMAHARF